MIRRFSVSETGVQRLKRVSESLHNGGPPAGETVRTLLSWFGAQRRGYWVVAEIRRALAVADLQTLPDFESAYIDSTVEFRLNRRNVEMNGTAALSSFNASGVGSVVNPAVATSADPEPPNDSVAQGHGSSGGAPNAAHPDAAFRISKLAAANSTPKSVKPDAPLSEAVTRMLAHDFSQLPVMSSERDVKGVISWKSIASRLAMGQSGECAREFMDPVEILDASASLFDAINVIVDKQYVLVRAPDKRIVGIVTSSDLSVQFQSLTEPFLLLAEIENDLRRVLQARFTKEELNASKDPLDTGRVIDSAHDMTFGEYIRLLENPAHWQKLGEHLDRSVFIDSLRAIKEIRNDVMHFDPDGIPLDDLNALRAFSRFMHRLRDIGVT